jgi:hypothetical protein
MMTETQAERTAEGWLMIDTEYRNDDPHVLDDCWHRGPYWVYSVRGTRIRVESHPSDGIGEVWDRLEDSVRAAGLAGIVELFGRVTEGLGYRVIRTIPTDAELIEMKRVADEQAVLYSGEYD